VTQLPPALCEDEVVAAIAAIAGEPRNRRILLGIGDDAAVWQPSRSHRSVVTTDMLVEDVHFARDLMAPADAGWRAMSANVSDLAAMGARPLLATVAFGFSAASAIADVCEFYCGMAQAALEAGLTIAGGDLSRAPVTTIAIAAIGEVRPSDLKTRGGGRPGDVLAVTGELGASRAGLFAAQQSGLLTGALRDKALAAFRRPHARWREGRFLAASRNVAAMMDCSDGLSTDLDRLCRVSGTGAVIESVPVASEAAHAAQALGEEADRFALAGGEEFELLVAIRPRAFAHLAARFLAQFGRPLLRVGRLREEPGVEYCGAPLERGGWDHFAPAWKRN
jgi:thiamine-monophosphate kinase